MLTRKQKKLLMYLADTIQEDGVAPSFDEMKEALGLKSKSGIHRMILALEERGFIRRLPNRARAIEILRVPHAMHKDEPGSPPGFKPEVITGGIAPQPVSRHERVDTIPLYGRIAAGTPIEALRDPDRMIEVPPGLMGAGEHYALEVSGDSMIEAGIFDGDTVLIRAVDTAPDGAIVVALVDGEEATLKTLMRDGQYVLLHPANQHFQTQRLEGDRVRIQGQLTGLLRRY